MEYRPSFSDQLDVDYISHHGVKGMKWGVRRYEDYTGHLTPLGKIRYDSNNKQDIKKRIKEAHAENKRLYKQGKLKGGTEMYKIEQEYKNAMKGNKTLAQLKKAANESDELFRYSEDLREGVDRRIEDTDYGDHSKMTFSQALYDTVASEVTKNAENKSWEQRQNDLEAYQKEYQKVAQPYIDRMKKQAIKDLKFEDAEKGRVLMDHYNLWDAYYKIPDESNPYY